VRDPREGARDAIRVHDYRHGGTSGQGWFIVTPLRGLTDPQLKSGGSVARDAGSACDVRRAEGFGRFGHREFAHFTNIARASLQETQNHILDAQDRGFVTNEEFERLWTLSDEALASTTALL
jgi:four helix bundle protein